MAEQKPYPSTDMPPLTHVCPVGQPDAPPVMQICPFPTPEHVLSHEAFAPPNETCTQQISPLHSLLERHVYVTPPLHGSFAPMQVPLGAPPAPWVTQHVSPAVQVTPSHVVGGVAVPASWPVTVPAS
jgi:hypothetical protein